MSTIEEFKNAPIGTTATHTDGSRAVKINDGERSWVTPTGVYYGDNELEYWNFTLSPSAPATAREALEIAWELAHEVKPGQVIPEGTRYLEVTRSGLRERTAQRDIKIRSAYASSNRTVEPLPDPEPDWLDAPAVIAVCNDTMNRAVFVREGDDSWRSEFYGAGTADLRDVIPLYPKERAGSVAPLYPNEKETK